MFETYNLKYICIHAHFYQPPRENPWTGIIERHASAYPFNNWNERIAAESYIPNTNVPILNLMGKVAEYINNYEYISFNFGPTLFSWIDKEYPELYAKIIEADRRSCQRFSGHGGAIAQPYNHIIMPLANKRDKRTQIIWGIKDFEYRFGRLPEGMWLPETAADNDTLEVMVDEGIGFTILAPSQAKAIRRKEDSVWIDDLEGEDSLTRRPYSLNLPSGRTIAIFFYNGYLSHNIAFGDMLDNGDSLAKTIMQGFDSDKPSPEIISVATDGETYGHHHKFADKALAYAIHHINAAPSCNMTVYAEYLAKYPPEYEVKIVENSSWSCKHGVERWRGDCGCNIGRDETWNQGWKKPLRETLDWLRDRLISLYEERASVYMKDPWKGRNEYINLILGDTADLPSDNIFSSLSDEDRGDMIRCLEMERYAMLMYTSCGWFFDDISRVETIQIIRYAAKAISLAAELGEVLEPEFLERLRCIVGNRSEVKDGEVLYNMYVRPLINSNENLTFEYYD